MVHVHAFNDVLLYYMPMGNEGLVVSGKYYILWLLLTHYVFSIVVISHASAAMMAFEGQKSEIIQRYPLIAFFFFPITPLYRRKSLLVPVRVKLTH